MLFWHLVLTLNPFHILFIFIHSFGRFKSKTFLNQAIVKVMFVKPINRFNGIKTISIILVTNMLSSRVILFILFLSHT